MDRTYQYIPDAICDACGHMGAFDIMGDYYCQDCVAAGDEGDDDEDADDWNEDG